MFEYLSGFKDLQLMADTLAYKKYDRMLVAVDCIIFGFDGSQLKALFVQRDIEPQKDKWSLMGGFAGAGENIDAAACRVLEELTGLKNIYMEQLRCYGDAGRDPGGRVVAVAYTALINIQDYPKELMATHRAKWFSLKSIPALIFDHKEMVRAARRHLQEKAVAHPLSFEMLPEKFTMAQLNSLYDAIFETRFDKRNFSKKIQSLHILRKLDEKDASSSRKGSYFFVFDKQQFSKREKEGIKFI